MQALIQRVSHASVKIDDNIVSSIGKGLAVFVGVGSDDTDEDAQYLADKVAEIRIFSDEEGKFNLSLKDIDGQLLVVSQFTLMSSTRKGRRPSFTKAAPPELAEPLIEKFTKFLRDRGIIVETGRFRSYMLVEIANDGPVTISIDSQDRLKPRK